MQRDVITYDYINGKVVVLAVIGDEVIDLEFSLDDIQIEDDVEEVDVIRSVTLDALIDMVGDNFDPMITEEAYTNDFLKQVYNINI